MWKNMILHSQCGANGPAWRFPRCPEQARPEIVPLSWAKGCPGILQERPGEEELILPGKSGARKMSLVSEMALSRGQESPGRGTGRGRRDGGKPV